MKMLAMRYASVITGYDRKTSDLSNAPPAIDKIPTSV